MASIPLLALQAACLLVGNVIAMTLRTCYSRYIRVLIIAEGADATGTKDAFSDLAKQGWREHGQVSFRRWFRGIRRKGAGACGPAIKGVGRIGFQLLFHKVLALSLGPHE
jgi:hypothetical protein